MRRKCMRMGNYPEIHWAGTCNHDHYPRECNEFRSHSYMSLNKKFSIMGEYGRTSQGQWQ